jgi:RAD51-like protein 3
MPPLTAFETAENSDLIACLKSLSVPVYTAESLLERDAIHLAKETHMQLDSIEAFRLEVARGCCPPSRLPLTITNLSFDTAGTLMNQSKKKFFTTGSAQIDLLVGGGLLMNEVTEIVGRSSSGKTQLCMTVAAEAAICGENVIFIDTSNGFSGTRVIGIIESRCANATAEHIRKIVSRIRIVSVFDIFEVLDFLQTAEQIIFSCGDDSTRCSLLILDGVTSLLAPLLGGEGKSFTGQAFMMHLGATLNRIAHSHDVGVLITNDAREFNASEQSAKDGSRLRPALGRSWNYMNDVRILLDTAHDRDLQSLYMATVLKHPHFQPPECTSPHALKSFAAFTIGTFGVK